MLRSACRSALVDAAISRPSQSEMVATSMPAVNIGIAAVCRRAYGVRVLSVGVGTACAVAAAWLRSPCCQNPPRSVAESFGEHVVNLALGSNDLLCEPVVRVQGRTARPSSVVDSSCSPTHRPTSPVGRSRRTDTGIDLERASGRRLHIEIEDRCGDVYRRAGVRNVDHARQPTLNGCCTEQQVDLFW